MLIYAGSHRGTQAIHIFVGHESYPAMDMGIGAAIPIGPILAGLDTQKQTTLVVKLVESEAETAQVAQYNLMRFGTPVMTPPVDIRTYGDVDHDAIQSHVTNGQGGVTYEKRPMDGEPPQHHTQPAPPPPPAKKPEACIGCGATNLPITAKGFCASCAQINENLNTLEQDAALPRELQNAMFALRNQIAKLEEFGVKTGIVSDPGLSENEIQVSMHPAWAHHLA